MHGRAQSYFNYTSHGRPRRGGRARRGRVPHRRGCCVARRRARAPRAAAGRRVGAAGRRAWGGRAAARRQPGRLGVAAEARWIAASLPADVDVYAPLLDHAEPSGSRCIPADASSSPASRTAGGTREVPVDHAVLVAAPVAGARWVELLPSWLLRWKISAKLEEELRHHRWRTRAWP